MNKFTTKLMRKLLKKIISFEPLCRFETDVSLKLCSNQHRSWLYIRRKISFDSLKFTQARVLKNWWKKNIINFKTLSIRAKSNTNQPWSYLHFYWIFQFGSLKFCSNQHFSWLYIRRKISFDTLKFTQASIWKIDE